MRNPFLKCFMKEEKENIFHSSAYGRAQNAGAIGVASVESFKKRMKMEQNRQMVQAYNDSRVVNKAYMNGSKAKKYVPKEKREDVMKKSVLKEKESEAVVGNTKNTVSTSIKKTFTPGIRLNSRKQKGPL